MTEQYPQLSPEEFSSVRIQSLGLSAAREAYISQVQAKPNSQAAQDSFAELQAAAEKVPFERIAMTSLAITDSTEKIKRYIRDAKQSEAENADDPHLVRHYRHLGDQSRGAYEYLASLEEDMDVIIEEAGRSWPIPGVQKHDKLPGVSAVLSAPTSLEQAENLESGDACYSPIPETNGGIASALPHIQLERPKSEHATVYERLDSVKMAMEKRRGFDRRAPERKQTDLLASRVSILECQFLANPENKTYRDYFTPEEVIRLTDMLLEARIHKDDAGYMQKIIDLARPYSEVDPYYAERNQDYFFVRDDEEIANYTMNEERKLAPVCEWDNHQEDPTIYEEAYNLARAASEKIRQYMFAGGSLNTRRKNYLLQMDDIESSDAWPGMRDVYQFIADHHAYLTLGELRQTPARSNTREVCIRNAQTILQWAQDNKALIDAIPGDFVLSETPKINKSKAQRLTEELPAKAALRRQIGIMSARMKSTDSYGTLKGLSVSPNGVYNLQLVIAITVERIKEELSDFHGELSIKPIEPLI